jgi:uncharacterized membrane protein (DUF4010 family)
MKLERIGIIAEIIGSIAVVVTLAYLATQTRQTNNALLASSRQASMSADVTILAALIQTPKAFTNLHKPYAEMSLEEQEQSGNVVAALIRVREYAWFQYKNGVMDEAALRSYMAPMVRWLTWGDTRLVWQLFAKEVDPEFVAYVDRMVQEAAPAQ